MIPVKLQIKNFLSYGDTQTIDFGAYHLICLSGKNGHGKSALLDAITWALWGQARKITNSAKPDHGLLKLGTNQMLVIFDFKLNNILYRVRRDFSFLYGKPHSSLEFGILDSQTGSLQPLTDKTIKATQERIESIIRLDFNSFVNSAFLRQGNANEFSKKTAKERKDILASILGLNQYELIRKKALEKIREYQIELQAIELMQTKLSQELGIKQNIEKQLHDINNQTSFLHTKQAEYEQRKKDLEEKLSLAKQEEHALAMLIKQREKLEITQKELQQSVRAYLKQWRTIRATLRNIPNPQEISVAQNRISKDLEKQQRYMQELLEYKERALTYRQQITTIEHQVTQEHTQSLQAITVEVAREKSAIETLTASLVDSTALHLQIQEEQKKIYAEQKIIGEKLRNLTDLQITFTAFERQFEKRREYYQKYIAHGNIITSQIRQAEQKNELVLDADNPSCPLCEQNVSASRKRFLNQKLHDNKKHLHHQLQRITLVINRLKELLLTQYNLYKDQKEQIALIPVYQLRDQELQKQYEHLIIRINEITQQIQDKELRIAQTQKILAEKERLFQTTQNQKEHLFLQHNLYQELILLLREVETRIAQTEYQPTLHAQLKKEYDELEKARALYASSQQLTQERVQIETSIQLACTSLKTIKSELSELSQHIRMAQNGLTHKESLMQEYTNLEQIIASHAQRIQEAMRIHAQLTAQEKTIVEYEQSIQENMRTIAQLNNHIFDYQTIAHATGKDGIQALLIEESIPEIEHEANQLLAKLTNNQAHLFIESLRDLKKGGSKETLDIKISDGNGLRPYEMFSGGEAFRIDFALRIAISKLLARRAGTSLQTLIIDEGFGSQDDEGLSHIMDTIYKIQDDFEKIIIVSHLSTLKDQFPVHFLVEKQANGSRVHIIEQG